ncbi:hypothetical protein J2X69_004947 [Algoriphagus sp. 4150]|nr:hypothetical protein [Algoriphagus sp. 4150]
MVLTKAAYLSEDFSPNSYVVRGATYPRLGFSSADLVIDLSDYPQ